MTAVFTETVNSDSDYVLVSAPQGRSIFILKQGQKNTLQKPPISCAPSEEKQIVRNRFNFWCFNFVLQAVL